MKYVLSATIVTVIGCIAIRSKAQDIEHSVQLGLSTNLGTYSSTSENAQTPLGDIHTDVSTTIWGPSEYSGVMLEGGYALTDALVLGGIGRLGGTTITTERAAATNDTTGFSLMLAPKLDYLLLPGAKFRPFIGAAAGLVHSSVDTELTTTTLTGLALFGRVGGKWFLNPGFSIDPAINFGWDTTSGSYETVTRSYDANASSYSIGLSVGFSGWVR